MANHIVFLVDVRLDQREVIDAQVAANELAARKTARASADLEQVTHQDSTGRAGPRKRPVEDGVTQPAAYAARLAMSFRFRQWPFAAFVPDLVARQPAPRRLHRED